MKNRTIIGIVCIALALVLMFALSPIVSHLSAGKITVVQLNKPIAEGSRITQNDVVQVEIGKHGVSGAILDAKEVVGKYATADLFPNCNLTPAMLTSQADNADAVLRTLDEDHVAISVTVPSFAGALSAKLENGDIVSVLITANGKTYIPKALTYVRVITTTTGEGVDQDEVVPDENGNVDLPATVTLYVTPVQAMELAKYEADGKVHFALVHRGDDKKAQEYLDAQRVLLEELALEQEEENAENPNDTTRPTRPGGGVANG